MKKKFATASFLAAMICGCALDRNGSSNLSDALADSDVIIFGEIHGTKESPAFFGRYVEQVALKSNKPILVGLEIPPDALAAAKAVSSKCKETSSCKELLLKSAFWEKSRDGRSSQANFNLIVRLSSLEKRQEIVLIGFDKRVTGRESFGSLVAQQLQNRSMPAKAILLTGNGHAHFDSTPNSIPAALQNDNKRVAVANLQPSGGAAWVCGGGECGVRKLEQRDCKLDSDGPKLQVGVELNFCLGALTASPPAVELIEAGQ